MWTNNPRPIYETVAYCEELSPFCPGEKKSSPSNCPLIVRKLASDTWLISLVSRKLCNLFLIRNLINSVNVIKSSLISHNKRKLFYVITQFISALQTMICSPFHKNTRVIVHYCDWTRFH